jgi:GntR family transcriptional regulator/MocR family aminotransferase
MAQVVSIYRYPVKGLSAQALTEVRLETGKPFPSDRIYALARPSAPIDRDNPQWAKKGLFAMLMLDEALARVTTELDLDDMRLTIRRKGQVAMSGRLDVEKDQRAIEAFFWTFLPDFPAAPALVRSRGGHFMDKPDNVISMINLATVRTLEALWWVPIDPLRFRANIYIDGAKPWEEFDWIGRDVRSAARHSRSTARTGAAARPTSTRRPESAISTSHRPFVSPSAIRISASI